MWQKRYDSAQQTIKEQAEIIDSLTNLVNVLKAEKVQWEAERSKQLQIITQQLSGSDDIVRKLQDEIRELRLKYNIKD